MQTTSNITFLLYCEPFTELEIINWKCGWFEFFFNRIISVINKSFPSSEIHFIFGEWQERTYKNNIYPKEVIPHVVLDKDLGGLPDYLTTTCSFFKDENSKECEAMPHIIKQKLGNTKPSIVFSFCSSIPFIKKLYNEAIIFYCEAGFSTRPPFKTSLYLDIFALIFSPKGYIGRFKDRLLSLELTTQGKEFINTFRNAFVPLIAEKSPFREFVSNQRKKFKKIVLCPLSVSRYFAFDSLTHIKTQLEYVLYALNNIDTDIGVIFINHDSYYQQGLTREATIDYLKHRYPNFIYETWFDNYSSCSLFFLPLVDGLICFNSSLGLQALLFKTPVFASGNSHIKSISETQTIKEIGNWFQNGTYRDKDAILYHLLTHYYIPDSYLFNENWFYNFIKNSIDKWKNNEVNFDFYNLIDDQEKILNLYLQNIVTNIPVYTETDKYRILRLEKEINEKNNKICELEKEKNEIREFVKTITSTISWKITKPLRMVKRLIQK